MKTSNLDENIRNATCEDVPNLGSIITLDNKGRLINSQFSKPSSSQTLLKLNSIEEIPDADDLPYSIISYGDTPNFSNLSYNDHNYASIHYSKKTDNYDKKALDFISKQNLQPTTRVNFNTNNTMRISSFNSYNTGVSQNDSIFFGDKYKAQNQIIFNQQISQSSTPVVTKAISSISQSNGLCSKNKMQPGTIVINSGSVNKLKGMNVIQLRRPSLDTSKMNETRIINLPIQKQASLTNIISTSHSNGNINSMNEKTDLLKSINLIPRCICAFTHDDGGMIRCEICRTWQHIVCMYPDNKFPIYYKCERCDPREVNVKRAVTIQTNILIKTGYNPSDFVVHQQYSEYDLDNDNLDNNYKKSTVNGSHFVIMKPDLKSDNYRTAIESIPNTQIPLFINASKDAQTAPPGSPRTSKRKQDLISLKSVLSKPSTLNTDNINSRVDFQKSALTTEMIANYNLTPNYTVPTSSHKLLPDQNESMYYANEITEKLKYILRDRVQFHTNLTTYQQQYLKLNNFMINTDMYEVILFDFSCYAIKAVKEFNATEIIMEFNGFISLAEEYNNETDFKKIYNPYVLLYDKYDRLPICIDSKNVDNKARYVRRSCTPNAEVKHRLLQDGQIRFYIVPINRISKDSEVTIAFDYNYNECRYPVECACNQPHCQLLYIKPESEYHQLTLPYHGMDCNDMNLYENSYATLDVENTRAPVVTMTRPYKKRGRASKILNSSNRVISGNVVQNTPKPEIVRRNKRGRPPLNRVMGIQRADIVVKPPPESSSSNNTLSDLNDESDNESNHSISNENILPPISIHSNFKNFKRISSSHWSLKSNRKMAATVKPPKPVPDLLVPPRVGRPPKSKKVPPVKFEPEVEYQSDHSEPKKPVRTFNRQPKYNYSETNEKVDYDSNSQFSDNHDQDDEGKYWLEEINNKIQKQKAKEAKKLQKKGKHGRKKMISKSPENLLIKDEVVVETFVGPKIELQQKKEVKKESINVYEEIPVKIDAQPNKKETIEGAKKAIRGRKSQKPNTSYILSYKPSNIDDLKNDLMLISASLEEDERDDNSDLQEHIKEIHEGVYVNEVIIEESMGNIEEPSSEFVYQGQEDHLARDTESDTSVKMNDSSLEEKSSRSKSKHNSMDKSGDSAKERAAKASREDRWVNSMWKRILKNEAPEDKLKRRRSKSSAADSSIASEDNQNEPSEIGSPKMTNSELLEDRDSSSNSKSSSAQKRRRTTTQLDNGENLREEDIVKATDRPDIIVGSVNDASISSSLPGDERRPEEEEESVDHSDKIVCKDQHSDTLERFSRDIGSEPQTPDSVTDTLHDQPITPNVPHTKKRWLNQAHMEETFGDDTLLRKFDVTVSNAIDDKLSSIDNVSKRSFLPPIIQSVNNIDISPTTIQKFSVNPKKRLLNQFSLGDTSLSSQAVIDEIESRVPFKSSKSEISTDQEQAKTKLTLSEYRKRRFNDKVFTEDSVVLPKYSKADEDISTGWIGTDTIKIEKMTEEEVNENSTKAVLFSTDIENHAQAQAIHTNVVIGKSEMMESSLLAELSYIETLNNLPMPRNIDPRLSKLSIPVNSTLSHMTAQDLPVITYNDPHHPKKAFEIFQPKSPSDSPDSDNEDRMVFHNGPRTPSDNEDMLHDMNQTHCPSVGRHSAGSVHSIESQPSPTSDCHFDFVNDANTIEEGDKTRLLLSSDWTSNAATIGKMAGIKNPELLQEIDEFEDEYIPLPSNLPQRTKEEIETLLLTQKRDSQIREWQEVKQLEREKVKLNHQVRSMERRLHRSHKPTDGKGHSGGEDWRKKFVSKKEKTNPLAHYDVRNDEKTMKEFNVQLANINGRLMAQIESLRTADVAAAKGSPAPQQQTKSDTSSHRFISTASGRGGGPITSS